MRPSSSAMIRNCAASLSLSLGAASVLSFVQRLMRPGGSECVRPCPQVARNACAPMDVCRTGFSALSGSLAMAQEIFRRHTELIEPLSLDEAYLDVTENKTGLPTATALREPFVSRSVRNCGLTASAGVAPNKFLAKIASDWAKPDGLFVIQPEMWMTFLSPLPVGRLPGVGKVTERSWKNWASDRRSDLREFGFSGTRRALRSIWHASLRTRRGIDQ